MAFLALPMCLLVIVAAVGVVVVNVALLAPSVLWWTSACWDQIFARLNPLAANTWSAANQANWINVGNTLTRRKEGTANGQLISTCAHTTIERERERGLA